MSKIGESVKQTVKYILLVLAILLILLATWNYICRIIGKIQTENAYGRKITVDGKTMVVDVTGNEDKPSLILLPGWGCASPVLEFRPLVKRLSKEYQVITIEPFGYGLSDGTEKERTAKNIVRELHECVNQLGCEKYYLMGHSIAGIYSLYWANQYPEEVEGFIGIDPSVPKMEDEEPFPIRMVTINKLSAYGGKAMNLMGVSRLKSMINPKSAVYADRSYPYTQREWEVFKILSIDYAYNKTVLRELAQMDENQKAVRNLKFPKEIPVLEFISEDNCKMMPAWEQLHRDTIAGDGTGEIVKMSGGHYLHLEHPDEITERIIEWDKDDLKGGNTDQAEREADGMVSGGSESHWYHLDVTVKKVDKIQKILFADVTDNEFFDAGEIQVDCSKKSVDLEKAEAGEQVTIYFFKSSISGNTVRAEDIK